MDLQAYLKRLRKELKGLPREEEALLVEEISSHFSEGLADAGLGEGEHERLDRLSREMGDPQELGRRLKDIHHPKRWLEYLLITLPEMFVLPVLSWIILVVFFGPGNEAAYLYWSIRASILFKFGLVLTGLWFNKRQGLLAGLLYWLCSLWLTIFSLCFRERRWFFKSGFNQTVQSVFWSAALVFLLVWLVKLLVKRKDPLYFTLVSIPFLVTLGNLATTQVILAGGFPEGYLLSDWNFIWNFGVSELARLVWPAVFLFPKQRVFRWLALLIYVAPVPVLNLIESVRYPHLIALWVLPFFLVGLNGVFDTIHQKRNSRIVR